MYDNSDEFGEMMDPAMIKSALNFELIQRVFQLNDEARVKLLAFLHLADELHLVRSEIDVNANGDLALKLFNHDYQSTGSQPEHENAAEPLQ